MGTEVDEIDRGGAMTGSRRDSQPAGGGWQGITRAGSVASAIRVNRAPGPQAIVFIAIDDESLEGSRGKT